MPDRLRSWRWSRYLHGEAIRSAYEDFGIQLNIPDVFGDFDDVPQLVAAAVHEQSESSTRWADLAPENQREKESSVKRILNRQATARMDRELLNAVDPAGELISWFEDMKRLMGDT